MATNTDQAQKTAKSDDQAVEVANQTSGEVSADMTRPGAGHTANAAVPVDPTAAEAVMVEAGEQSVDVVQQDEAAEAQYDEEAAIEELFADTQDGELPESAEGVLLAQADTSEPVAQAESGESASAEGGESGSASSSAGTGALSGAQIGLIGAAALGVAVAADDDDTSSTTDSDSSASTSDTFTLTTGEFGLNTQVGDPDDTFFEDVEVDTGDFDGLVTAVITVTNGTLAEGGGNITITTGDPTEATYVGAADGLEAAIQALTYEPVVTEAGTDTVSITVEDGAGNTLTEFEETVSIGEVLTAADAEDGAITGTAQSDLIALSVADMGTIDSVDGGEGLDVLGVELAAGDDLDTSPTLENIIAVSFEVAGGPAATVDASLFSDLEEGILLNGAGDVTLNDLAADDTVRVNETVDVTLNLAEEQASGETFSVELQGDFDGTVTAGEAGEEGETLTNLTLDVSETQANGDVVTVDGGNLETLNITGGEAGGTTINVAAADTDDADDTFTINASSYTGEAIGEADPVGVTLDDLSSNSDLDVTGSSADDTFNVVQAIDADDSFDGGAGDDTLNITAALVDLGVLDISNVETINLEDTNATATAIAANFLNVQDAELISVQAEDEGSTFNLDNVNANTAVGVNGVIGDLTLGFGGTTRAHTVQAVENAAAVALLEADPAATDLTLDASEENLTVSGLTGASLETLTITGSNNVDVTINAGAEGITTIDASAATGEVTVIGANLADDATITGGSGENTLTGGVGDDTIIGGAGDDIITGGAGADTLIGGDGANTFVQGNDSVESTAQTLDNGDDDTLLQATDVLTFGDGVDVIQDFTAGTDVIDGFENGDGETAAESAIDETADDLSADTIFFLSGAFDGTDFVIDADGDGADTLVFENEGTDGNDDISTLTNAIVLSGVDSDDLGAVDFT